MTDGFMQYQILINHAEIIAISSGKLDEDKYKEELGELDKKLQERLKKDDKSYKMAFAMIKYKLILKALLSIRKSNMTLNC